MLHRIAAQKVYENFPRKLLMLVFPSVQHAKFMHKIYPHSTYLQGALKNSKGEGEIIQIWQKENIF